MAIETQDEIKLIKLEDLLPNPYQPESRLQVDEETAKEFGLSILNSELIQTPICRRRWEGPSGGQKPVYEIGDGWLRLAGYKWLVANGHPDRGEMPCDIRDLTDQQMADIVMETNTVRKGLNPIELAQFYRKYLENFGITQAELAEKHHCSQGVIANTIRLLDLPEDIHGKIISQEISEAHGRQLLRLNKYPDMQKKMVKNVVSQNLTVNDLSNRVQSEIFANSKSLDRLPAYRPGTYNDPPKFDITGCEKCEHAEKLGSPYNPDKKELRCTDPDCWREKQKAAEQAGLEAEKEKLREQGIERVYTPDELKNSDYSVLYDHFLDEHPECRTCAHRAGLKHFVSGSIEIVCIDTECYQEKVNRRSAELDAERSRGSDELKERIESAVGGLKDLEAAMRAVIRLSLWDDSNGEFAKSLLGRDLSEMENDYEPNEEIERKIAGMDLEQLIKTLLLFLMEVNATSWRCGEVAPILENIEAINTGEPVSKPERITSQDGEQAASQDGEQTASETRAEDPLATLEIKVPEKAGAMYHIILGGEAVMSKTLKEGVIERLSAFWGLPQDTTAEYLGNIVRICAESENRTLVLGILGQEEEVD